MWILLAIFSAICLGFYDICKKTSLKDNNVLVVLWLNTVFGTLLMTPYLVNSFASGSAPLDASLLGHFRILVKALIVLSSWLLGYFAIKHLPLTIQAPISSSRPVLVLVGAMAIFGERLNWLQWIGIGLGFASLAYIYFIGVKEGFSKADAKWLWMSIASITFGAASGLYDKFLLRHYEPLDVQACYSFYQCLMMSIAVPTLLLMQKRSSQGGARVGFKWRWSILGISIFLTIADIAYFYALAETESMVSVVSMIRRGSVIVAFLYGAIILHEKNLRDKILDLCLLFASLICLVVGATL